MKYESFPFIEPFATNFTKHGWIFCWSPLALILGWLGHQSSLVLFQVPVQISLFRKAFSTNFTDVGKLLEMYPGPVGLHVELVTETIATNVT